MSRKMNIWRHESGSWHKVMVFQNEKITPELAAELLHLNGKNRPVSDSFVQRYTKDMLDGKWVFNGDSIRISREGMIVDGQKKLLAIINSGTTQTFNIQTGLEPKSFNVMDIGQPRSAADTVAVAGYKNYNVIGNASKIIMAFMNGTIKNTVWGGTGKRSSQGRFSNQDVLNFIEKVADMDLLQEAATIGNSIAGKAKYFSPATYAAFFYMFAKKDREFAQLFFEMLSSGENISRTSYSYIYLLRERLRKIQESSYKLNLIDKMALMIKSWNYMRDGREIKSLTWQSTEDFPQIK